MDASSHIITSELHRGWRRLLSRATAVGLVADLTPGELRAGLGPGASSTPTARGFVRALHRYYDGRGVAEVAHRRRKADGFASVSVGEPMDAGRWITRLLTVAAPLPAGILPALALASNPRGPHALYNDGAEEWLELREVVAAANILLAEHRRERFVPLRIVDGRESYVLLSQRQAQHLDHVALLESDWEDVFDDEIVASGVRRVA